MLRQSDLKPEDKVQFVRRDGFSAMHALTLGNVYEVLGTAGANVITSSNEPGKTCSWWIGLARKIQN